MTAEEILDALEHPAEATRAIRDESGLSQRDLAELAGISRGGLRGIELGRHEPMASSMAGILRAAREVL